MRTSIRFTAVSVILLALVETTVTVAEEKSSNSVKFVMRRVGNFRSEACCVGDFNKDGKPDIVAGAYLYLGPDWKSPNTPRFSGSRERCSQGKCDGARGRG